MTTLEHTTWVLAWNVARRHWTQHLILKMTTGIGLLWYHLCALEFGRIQRTWNILFMSTAWNTFWHIDHTWATLFTAGLWTSMPTFADNLGTWLAAREFLLVIHIYWMTQKWTGVFTVGHALLAWFHAAPKWRTIEMCGTWSKNYILRVILTHKFQFSPKISLFLHIC